MTLDTHGVVQSLVEALNRHEIQAIAGLCAPDYYGDDCALADPQIGPESLNESLARYLEAFPDFTIEQVETIFQDGRVALYWVARGTHLGRFMNIPPSGKRVSVRGTTFLSLRENKIARSMTLWDVAGMLRGIGLLPEL